MQMENSGGNDHVDMLEHFNTVANKWGKISRLGYNRWKTLRQAVDPSIVDMYGVCDRLRKNSCKQIRKVYNFSRYFCLSFTTIFFRIFCFVLSIFLLFVSPFYPSLIFRCTLLYVMKVSSLITLIMQQRSSGIYRIMNQFLLFLFKGSLNQMDFSSI